jgi:hypothetical protein
MLGPQVCNTCLKIFKYEPHEDDSRQGRWSCPKCGVGETNPDGSKNYSWLLCLPKEKFDLVMGYVDRNVSAICPYDKTRMRMLKLSSEESECHDCGGFGRKQIEGAFFPPFDEECGRCQGKGSVWRLNSSSTH